MSMSSLFLLQQKTQHRYDARGSVLSLQGHRIAPGICLPCFLLPDIPGFPLIGCLTYSRCLIGYTISSNIPTST